MSTLTQYWSDETTRIQTALAAVRAERATTQSDWQSARQSLRTLADTLQTAYAAVAEIRKQLAAIPMPADGDPLLQQLSLELIALNTAQAAQAKAEWLVQRLQAQLARLEAHEAALQAELSDAKAQADQATKAADERQRIATALTTGIWKNVATDAAKALTDFAATATSRVEASFPASDPTKPLLLERVRARRDIAKALANGHAGNTQTAFDASHDALAKAGAAFDKAWADVRAYFDLSPRMADDRLALKSLASLPAPNPPTTLPILTPAQHKVLHDATKIAARETTLALLKAVDDLDETVRAAQATYDDAYNTAIAAKPDDSLAALLAGDLKVPKQNLDKAIADRATADAALKASAGYADLQSWIAAIPDTLWEALEQLDTAKSRLGTLKGPPVAAALLATLATKETDLVTALSAARLAQRKQAAAERGWRMSQDALAAAQATAPRLARAAGRGTAFAL